MTPTVYLGHRTSPKLFSSVLPCPEIKLSLQASIHIKCCLQLPTSVLESCCSQVLGGFRVEDNLALDPFQSLHDPSDGKRFILFPLLGLHSLHGFFFPIVSFFFTFCPTPVLFSLFKEIFTSVNLHLIYYSLLK